MSTSQNSTLLINATDLTTIPAVPPTIEWVPVGLTIAAFAAFIIYLTLSRCGVFDGKDDPNKLKNNDNAVVLKNKQTQDVGKNEQPQSSSLFASHTVTSSASLGSQKLSI